MEQTHVKKQTGWERHCSSLGHFILQPVKARHPVLPTEPQPSRPCTLGSWGAFCWKEARYILQPFCLPPSPPPPPLPQEAIHLLLTQKSNQKLNKEIGGDLEVKRGKGWDYSVKGYYSELFKASKLHPIGWCQGKERCFAVRRWLLGFFCLFCWCFEVLTMIACFQNLRFNC